MKLSELAKKLEEIKSYRGDIDVGVIGSHGSHTKEIDETLIVASLDSDRCTVWLVTDLCTCNA